MRPPCPCVMCEAYRARLASLGQQVLPFDQADELVKDLGPATPFRRRHPEGAEGGSLTSGPRAAAHNGNGPRRTGA